MKPTPIRATTLSLICPLMLCGIAIAEEASPLTPPAASQPAGKDGADDSKPEDAILRASREGDSKKALELAEKLTSTQPGKIELADVLVEAAATFATAKQFEAAAAFYRMLIARYADSKHLEHAHTELAACYYQIRELKACHEKAKENLKLYPNSQWVEYWEFLVAQTDFRLYEFAKAKSAYEAFLAKYPQSQYNGFVRGDLGRIDPPWEIDSHGLVSYSGKFEQDIRFKAALAATPKHIEEAYGILERLVGIDLRTHANLIFVFKDADGNSKGGLEAVTRIAGINNRPKTIIEFFTDTIVVNPAGYRKTIVHEMKHAGFIDIMGKSYHDLPVWVREGLAIWGSDDVASRTRLVLSNAITGGGDPMVVLDGIDDPDHDDSDYLEDGLAFAWLESVKPGNVKAFCRRLIAGEDYRKLWSELGGASYEECMVQANAYCRRRVTEALGEAHRSSVALRKPAEAVIGKNADAARAFLADGGEKNFTEWLDANDSHSAAPYIRVLLGRALITAGRHQEGRAQLQHIIDKDAENTTLLDDAQFFIGFSYNEEKDAPNAHQALGVLLRDFPRSPHGKQFVGQLKPAPPVTQ